VRLLPLSQSSEIIARSYRCNIPQQSKKIIGPVDLLLGTNILPNDMGNG
jgi:hypothetical protein